MKNKHVGSDFDDLLRDQGMLPEAEAVAIKRVIAYQVQEEMTRRKISKTELTRLMGTSRSSLSRLLDPDNVSVTLLTLENAALALGKKLKVELA